jgi:hypothetical protein
VPPEGGFPEEFGAGSFCLRVSPGLASHGACPFGALQNLEDLFPAVILTIAIAILREKGQKSRMNLLNKNPAPRGRRRERSAGQGAAHPVADQPVFEVLSLADLDGANDAIDEAA